MSRLSATGASPESFTSDPPRTSGQLDEPVIPEGTSTTWLMRFNDVMIRFCGIAPPSYMVEAWFTTEDEELQTWVLDHCRASWAQGIELIDAAERLADTPAVYGSYMNEVHEHRPPHLHRY